MKRVLKLIGISFLSIGLLVGMAFGIASIVVSVMIGAQYILALIGGMIVFGLALNTFLNIANKHLS
jgi:hypothetical protein